MVNVTQCWRGGVKAVYSTGMVLNEYGVTPGYVSCMHKHYIRPQINQIDFI